MTTKATTRPKPDDDSEAGRTLTIRLAPEIIARIDAAAEERLLGRARLVEILLADGLDRLVPVAELQLLRDFPPAPTVEERTKADRLAQPTTPQPVELQS